MQMELTYTAPVVVTVDTASGTVTRVVVTDASIAPGEFALADPEAAFARMIAEHEVWPAWEFGF
jgi:hypothetical protein